MSEEQTKYKPTVESGDLDEVLFLGNVSRYYRIINEIEQQFHAKWKYEHDKDWFPYDMVMDILREFNFHDD